jgi:hypothetical protein
LDVWCAGTSPYSVQRCWLLDNKTRVTLIVIRKKHGRLDIIKKYVDSVHFKILGGHWKFIDPVNRELLSMQSYTSIQNSLLIIDV